VVVGALEEDSSTLGVNSTPNESSENSGATYVIAGVGGSSVSGTITYGNAVGAPSPRSVSNVTLTGSGSTTVTTTSGLHGDTAGQYTLNGFGSGAYTVTPSKIGGYNGAISGLDAARVAQHAVGPPLPVLTGNQLIVADVSGN